MKLILIIVFISLTSCAPILTDFRSQACFEIYCANSEENITKKAGLKIVEIAAGTYGKNIDLDQGICSKYYKKRGLDYRFSKNSAESICNGNSLK